MLKLVQLPLGPLLLNGTLATIVWAFFLATNRSAENYLRIILDLLLAELVATLAIPLNTPNYRAVRARQKCSTNYP